MKSYFNISEFSWIDRKPLCDRVNVQMKEKRCEDAKDADSMRRCHILSYSSAFCFTEQGDSKVSGDLSNEKY